MLQSFIKKKVTASPQHIEPGNSSAEIIGSGNMIRHRIVKKVTDTSSAEINAMAIIMPATGVKKVTVINDTVVDGSSRAEIDATFNMMPGTIAKNDKPKRGFQHLYKSTTTNSSRRVHKAYRATMRNGAPKSKKAIRRDKAKMKKIGSLMEVVSSTVHALGSEFLSTRPVFYSGTTNRMLPNPIPNGIMLSAIQDLRVIDTISGARMLSSF